MIEWQCCSSASAAPRAFNQIADAYLIHSLNGACVHMFSSGRQESEFTLCLSEITCLYHTTAVCTFFNSFEE